MNLVSRLPAAALILIAIFSVQGGAALAKSLFAQFGATGTVYLRLLFAALVLLIFVRPALSLLKNGTWRIVLLFGIVLALMNGCYYLALERIPLGLTVTVEFFGPLGVALWQSRKPLDFLWVALALGGVALLNPFSGGLDPIGLAFAGVAGTCWGAYILLGQKIGGSLPGAAGLTFSMMVGALLMSPIEVGNIISNVHVGWGLLAALGVAILSSVIPYTLEIEALRRMSTKQFGILMSLEPAVASLMGWLLLSEVLTPTQIFAVILVMFASYGVVRYGRNG